MTTVLEIGPVAVAAAILATHVSSIALAWPRSHATQSTNAHQVSPHFVTVIRPLNGLERFSEQTLRSTFELDHQSINILFCVGRASDPIVPLVQRMIAEYPARSAQLLIGDERISSNPKLNNLVKAWDKVDSDWVAFVDSNVELPADAIARLSASWDDGCGMVCSPPIGSHPSDFAAHIEAAFLNGYQARWQLAASAIGYGFAQGKVMFFRRELLTHAGGLSALASDPAEDAAATKVVRAAGLHVRVIQKPFEQPLGSRRLVDVWKRQLRWAQLRRATFPICFYPEIATSPLLPCLLLAYGLGVAAAAAIPLYLCLWYAAEAALSARQGWAQSQSAIAASLVRDCLLPAIWIIAIFKNKFEWQGNAMSSDNRHSTGLRT